MRLGPVRELVSLWLVVIEFHSLWIGGNLILVGCGFRVLCGFGGVWGLWFVYVCWLLVVSLMLYRGGVYGMVI